MKFSNLFFWRKEPLGYPSRREIVATTIRHRAAFNEFRNDQETTLNKIMSDMPDDLPDDKFVDHLERAIKAEEIGPK